MKLGIFLIFIIKTGKFKRFYLNSKKEFVEAYKKDLTLHWDTIKQDESFHLIHLVQNSTPDNLNEIAIAETFANCFAKIMNEADKIDFIELYFKNSLQSARKIINNFLLSINPPALKL